MNPIVLTQIVRSIKNITNEQVETAFYIFFIETKGDTEKISDAIELIKEHRPELASKVAKIIQQTPDETVEEIINLLAKDDDEKKLAFYIISIWNIHPMIAEKMDKKYSLGIKAIMYESRLLETYR